MVGGTRPPLPTSVGAIVPVPAGRAVALVSSVTVRLALVAPPARNSLTRPVTVTAVPGWSAASGAVLVKTKMPSDVRVSRSGRGSWMK